MRLAIASTLLLIACSSPISPAMADSAKIAEGKFLGIRAYVENSCANLRPNNAMFNMVLNKLGFIDNADPEVLASSMELLEMYKKRDQEEVCQDVEDNFGPDGVSMRGLFVAR